MKEKDFIPGIKYTTKEELKAMLEQKEAEIEKLHYELLEEKEYFQEKLYESGVEKRPTIMDQIEKKEEEARKTIRYIIEECEKETGRTFYSYPVPRIEELKKNFCPICDDPVNYNPQVAFYNSLNKAEL